jgi:hypothetical protein
MKSFVAVILGLALAFVSTSALAQEEAGGGQATTYDFEDDIVTGDLMRPDGEVLRTRRRGQRDSLLRVREHFVQEMLKSVENL